MAECSGCLPFSATPFSLLGPWQPFSRAAELDSQLFAQLHYRTGGMFLIVAGSFMPGFLNLSIVDIWIKPFFVVGGGPVHYK